VAILIVFVAMALFGQWLAPYNPDDTDLVARLTAPSWAGGAGEHLMGTDRLGRDVWSRIIAGAQPSFVVALVAIAVGGGIGTVIGLSARSSCAWRTRPSPSR
jgi:peptide/nickel transport system permease protein